MSRVDHLVISVPDIDTAAQEWDEVGLPSSPGGTHPGGTVNVLIRGSQHAYVELIAAPEGADNIWSERVRNTLGPLSWAICVPDIEAACQAATEAGFEPGDIRDGARTTESGEELSWRMVDLGEQPFDAKLPFLIEWIKPVSDGPAHGPVLIGMCVEVEHPSELEKLLDALDFDDKDVTVALAEGDRGLVSATFRTQEPVAEVAELNGLTVNLH